MCDLEQIIEPLWSLGFSSGIWVIGNDYLSGCWKDGKNWTERLALWIRALGPGLVETPPALRRQRDVNLSEFEDIRTA